MFINLPWRTFVTLLESHDHRYPFISKAFLLSSLMINFDSICEFRYCTHIGRKCLFAAVSDINIFGVLVNH